jgi:hypothetical protein
MHTSHGSLVAVALGAAFGLFLAACSSSSSASGGTTTAPAGCGTEDAPETLTLKDVTPAKGSAVPDQDIVHGFTVVSAPGLFKTLNLQYLAPAHTAGEADPSAWQWTAAAQGSDVRYEALGVRWKNAPGHVSVGSSVKFKTSNGCVYALPTPLFDYDVEAKGAGGAGQGGAAAGGSGGAGGSAAGGAGGAGGQGGGA